MKNLQLGSFVDDIVTDLAFALEQSPGAAQLLLDAFATELTLFVRTKCLDASEAKTYELVEACFALLTLCATRANASELHMATKTFLSKINAAYLEATSYLC